MKNIYKFGFLFLLVLMLLPIYVYARADFNSGNDFSITEDVDGTGMYAGNKLKIQSDIAGILFVGGSEVEVTNSNDYAFIGGVDIYLNMATNKDLFVVGNKIIFDIDSSVGRDAYINANQVYLRGNFARDINLNGGNVILENVVINGNIKISASHLTIEDSVKVLGKIEINDTADLDISPNANLAQVEYYKVSIVTRSALAVIKEKIFALMSLIILFVVTNAVFPKLFTTILEKVKDAKFNAYVSLFGIGFITMIIIPILAVISIVSGIGFAIGLLISLLFVITLTMSKVIMGYLIAQISIKNQFPKLDNELLLNILGLTIIFILTDLPIIGDTVSFGSFLIGLGILTKLIIKSKKEI